MSRRKRKMIRIGSGLVPLDGADYKVDYRARLKAAALDDDPDTLDIEATRGRVSRKISMFLNEWSGCREEICQRMRGCLAPGGACSNVEEEPFDRAAWDRDKIEIMRAIKQRLAETAAEEETDET